jgi:hypothetical protein
LLPETCACSALRAGVITHPAALAHVCCHVHHALTSLVACHGAMRSHPCYHCCYTVLLPAAASCVQSDQQRQLTALTSHAASLLCWGMCHVCGYLCMELVTRFCHTPPRNVCALPAFRLQQVVFDVVPPGLDSILQAGHQAQVRHSSVADPAGWTANAAGICLLT